MHKSFTKYWHKVVRRFRLAQLLAITTITVSIVLFTIGIAGLLGESVPIAFLTPYFILMILLIATWWPLNRFKESFIRNYMHQKFPGLEFSLALFFEKDLSAVGKIQSEKIKSRLPSTNKIPVAVHWQSLAILILSSLIVFFISITVPYSENGAKEVFSVLQKQGPASGKSSQNAEKEVFKKGELKLTVLPPAYTGLPIFVWKEGQKIPEGSLLEFEVTDGNMEPQLVFQGVDTISMVEIKNRWNRKYRLSYSTAFQLLHQSPDLLITDEIQLLEVLIDQKPIIRFQQDDKRIEIAWKSLEATLPIDISMKDDYGLNSAKVVATLSQGDGEAVEFREMRWPLPGLKTGSKSQNIRYHLRTDTLGIEPGDELYFFIELFDNKTPVNQKTKSEVFFIEVEDTVQQEPVAFEGLALSVEPEYFKSQRQIIIDTKKLLEERSKMSQAQFEDRSDEIGAEQKLLRLRYGIFLGEEYETTGGMGETAHGKERHEEDEEDQQEDEHAGHDHAEGMHPEEDESFQTKYEAPELQAYVHAHDESEIATFFDADVKKKLKEALANMWEAELYLRTYQPTKALPYEYKALALIKEVQRASRIYVLRMGFEPPPLEPDVKRLTGELEDINATTIKHARERDVFLASLRKLLSEMKQQTDSDDPFKRNQLVQALGEIIIAEMFRNPVRYAQVLAQINQYNQTASQTNFRQLIHLTEGILPSAKEKLSGKGSVDLQLNTIFHQQLENN